MEARQKFSKTLASLDASQQHITICYTNEKEVGNGYWKEMYNSAEGYWYNEYVVTSVETQRTEIVNQTDDQSGGTESRTHGRTQKNTERESARR